MITRNHNFKNGQLRWRSWNYSWEASYFITISPKDKHPYFGKVVDGKMILNTTGKLAEELWQAIPNQFNYIFLGEFVVMPDHIHGILIIDHPEKGCSKETDFDLLVGARLIAPPQEDDQIPEENLISEDDDLILDKHLIQDHQILYEHLIQDDLIIDEHQIQKDDQIPENDQILIGDLILDKHLVQDDQILENSKINPILNPNYSDESQEILDILNEPFTFDQNQHPIGGATGLNNPMFHDNISRVIRWYKGRCSFEVRKSGTPLQWQSRFYDHVIRNRVAFVRISHYIINNPKNYKRKKGSLIE